MSLPDTMKAMVTMGHGGLEQMVLHKDWPRPEPAAGEVLIRVAACGLNNTDVNTRSGWYSKTVTDATTGGAFEEVGEDDPTWGGAAHHLSAHSGGRYLRSYRCRGRGCGQRAYRTAGDNRRLVARSRRSAKHGQGRVLRVRAGWRLSLNMPQRLR